MRLLLFALILIAMQPCFYGAGRQLTMQVLNHYGSRFEGQFTIHSTSGILGWELKIHFSKPVSGLQSGDGNFTAMSGGVAGQDYIMVNAPYKGLHQAGTFTVRLAGSMTGDAPTATAEFVDLSVDHSQTVPPAVVPAGQQQTPFKYEEVLEKSLLFYEAQRSGKLPADNRIPWRADSATDDHGDNGEDLTGGLYDAGDHVKFNLPMAYTATMLAWGYLEWTDAYTASRQDVYLKDTLKWILEYLVKCHVAPHELYVQVGDGGQDHSFWGRPEDMTMARPAFKITESKPGSDVAGETAAAMAAGYLVFRKIDPAFANILLSHAKQIYEFATTFKGRYSDSVNQAAAYYRSNEFQDELGWSAIWLYQATQEEKYLQEAEATRVTGPGWGDSWDDKTTYTDILLYKFTRKEEYKHDIEATYQDWMPGGSIPYSPGGMAYRLQWGALRYAINMATGALMAADTGLNVQSYRCWAISQINYALGANPNHRSYVVGFGNNPPQRPHHRASSCPDMPAPCTWEEQTNPGPNPHTLYGALVGGPGRDDSYKDDRQDFIKNEVADDYNAAFQSGIAGLIHLALHNQYPSCS